MCDQRSTAHCLVNLTVLLVLSNTCEWAVQAFRLQLALEAGQFAPSGPCILDQRLHTKPHHQPILFVDDSQAPNLQLSAKPRSPLPSHGQIAASHAAAAGLGYSNSDESDQEAPPQALHGGVRGVGKPGGRLGGSCDEAESISSSPTATPLRLMQQLMSHGKARSHAPKPSAPAEAAASASRDSIEAEKSDLIRQASSNSSASFSSHMRVAGPSHGSDSRFAAMKSLTRSAISPRHAVSLDSPTKLAATRQLGTLAHNYRPNHISGTHAKSPAGCNFDLDLNSLSPASSFGGSAGSSFTEAHSDHLGAPSLAHLSSAPVAGSFAAALDAAASFADSTLSPSSVASPTAPLLAAAAMDSSSAACDDTAAARTTGYESAADGLPCVQAASHSMTDSAAVQTAGKAQNALHTPQGNPSGTHQGAQGNANGQHADAVSVMVNLPVSDGASKQVQQLPLSQDSLDFSLDSAYTPWLAEEASDSQQLLQPTSHTSASLTEDEQAELRHIGVVSSSVLEEVQSMPQDVLVLSKVVHRFQQPLQQLNHCSASLVSSHLLEQHDQGSSSHQQGQQLPCDLMPDQSADELDQQLLLQLDEAPAALSKDEEQPLLSLSDPVPLRAAGLVATGNADGTGSPLLPTAVGYADGAARPALPITTGGADAHKSTACSGERQQVGLLAGIWCTVHAHLLF